MGRGVSALGASAHGCMGYRGRGVQPHGNKRFLRLVPCALPVSLRYANE